MFKLQRYYNYLFDVTIFINYIQNQRNCMLYPYNKNKENRRDEIRKRFHFDPKIQYGKLKAGEIPKKTQIIIRDENGQFSSVKEMQDFNDSSWLAKLVNGIEESDRLSIKPLSQLSNFQQMNKHIPNSINGLAQNAFTIERKVSEQFNKFAGRKSVPSINNYRNKKKQNQNKKMSLHSLTISNQQIQKQKKIINKFKNSSKENENKNSNKLKQKQRNQKQNISRVKKIFEKTEKQSQEEKQNIKNSIINYSSIRQQILEQMNTKKQQGDKKFEAIMIDLDEISLKTEMSKQGTPIRKKNTLQKQEQKKIEKSNKSKKSNSHSNKNVIKQKQQKIKNEQNKKVDRKQKPSSIASSKVDNENIISNTNKQQNFIQSEINTPVVHNQKNNNLLISKENNFIQKCKNNQILKIGDEISKDNYLSSHNQFLDTFKHQIIINENKLPPPRMGIIKKNKKNKNVQNLQVKQNIDNFNIEKQINTQEDEQIQLNIPTFSDRLPQQKLIKKQLLIQDGSFCNKKNHNFSPLQKQSNLMKQSSIQKSLSTIKKGVDRTSRKSLQQIKLKHMYQLQKSCGQSPKFNQKIEKYSDIQYHMVWRKREIFQQVFTKLNFNNQEKIHKFNCLDSNLNEQEKYEFGSIISKIKYLDHSFSKNQFIQQCLKLQNFQSKSNNRSQKQSIIKTQINLKQESKGINLLNKLKQADTAYELYNLRREGPDLYRGSSLSEIKSIKKIINEPKILTSKKNENYSNQTMGFQPLFPQTISTNACYTQMLSSSYVQKIERLQKLSESNNFQAFDYKSNQHDRGDFGQIIDSLNSKLNNYIHHNNLEDTYRKFKLEFVQLRRNMQY